MAQLRRGYSSAFEAPSLHLRLYTLKNPMVCWAIAHGAYPTERVWRPHVRDVGDDESLEVARQLGIFVSADPADQYHES